MVAETIANCLMAYSRLVERGREDLGYPSALARFGAAQARQGRRVGGHLNTRDVLCRSAQVKKGFQVERLDQFNEDDDCWQEIVVEDRRATPAEVAAIRVDFKEWLGLLPGLRRRIALTLASGATTREAAEKYSVSPGRISQLRQWLKASWEMFQREPVAGVAAA
jgi:hypothetical protein